jgi:sugar (pentulose or hexulose) kinase
MTICHRDPDKWLRVMGVMMGTPNLDWFLKQLGGKLHSEALTRKRSLFQHMDEAVSEVRAGAGGVLYLPYLSPSGERAPFVKATARAQFTGLTINHTNRHLLRAVLEGVAFSIRDSYEHMPVPINDIKLTGGGARSAVWPQIIADVTGKTVSIPAVEETGTLGAALNAAVAIGLFPTIEEAVHRCVRVTRRFEPDLKNQALYDELFGLYRQTYKTMWELWDHHQRVVESKVIPMETR